MDILGVLRAAGGAVCVAISKRNAAPTFSVKCMGSSSSGSDLAWHVVRWWALASDAWSLGAALTVDETRIMVRVGRRILGFRRVRGNENVALIALLMIWFAGGVLGSVQRINAVLPVIRIENLCCVEKLFKLRGRIGRAVTEKRENVRECEKMEGVKSCHVMIRNTLNRKKEQCDVLEWRHGEEVRWRRRGLDSMSNRECGRCAWEYERKNTHNHNKFDAEA